MTFSSQDILTPVYFIYWGKVHSRSSPHAQTTQKFINTAKLMSLYQSRLYCHCSSKMFHTGCSAHLCRLCLQKCCMLVLRLDSLSGCPLSSRRQVGGCLWLRSTFYCLRSSHWWRMPSGPFLLTRRFLQAGGWGHKIKNVRYISLGTFIQADFWAFSIFTLWWF